MTYAEPNYTTNWKIGLIDMSPKISYTIFFKTFKRKIVHLFRSSLWTRELEYGTTRPYQEWPPPDRFTPWTLLMVRYGCLPIFDFRFQVFFMNQFPPSPIRAVSNLLKILLLKVHHQYCWHQWQLEKIFDCKSFIYLVWTPMGSRVKIKIIFFSSSL